MILYFTTETHRAVMSPFCCYLASTGRRGSLYTSRIQFKKSLIILFDVPGIVLFDLLSFFSIKPGLGAHSSEVRWLKRCAWLCLVRHPLTGHRDGCNAAWGGQFILQMYQRMFMALPAISCAILIQYIN
jgi:hypothetical protein